MAMSSAADFAGLYAKSWDVTANADGDAGDVVIAHGFGAVPVVVTAVPLQLAGISSNWSVAWDATNITVSKNSAAMGTGDADAQLKVIAMLPHTITQ